MRKVEKRRDLATWRPCGDKASHPQKLSLSFDQSLNHLSFSQIFFSSSNLSQMFTIDFDQFRQGLEVSHLSSLRNNEKGPYLSKLLRSYNPNPSTLDPASREVQYLETKLHSSTSPILSVDYALLLSSSQSIPWILNILDPKEEPLKASQDYTIIKVALISLGRLWNKNQKSLGELIDGLGGRGEAVSTLVSILQRLSYNRSTDLLSMLSRFSIHEDRVRTGIIDGVLRQASSLPKNTFKKLISAASTPFLTSLLKDGSSSVRLMGMESKWWKRLAESRPEVMSNFVLTLFKVRASTETSIYHNNQEFEKLIREDVIPTLSKGSTLIQSTDESIPTLTSGQALMIHLLKLSRDGENSVHATSTGRLDSVLEQVGLVASEGSKEFPPVMTQPGFLNKEVGKNLTASAKARLDSILVLATQAFSQVGLVVRSQGLDQKSQMEETVRLRIYLFNEVLLGIEAASQGFDLREFHFSLNQASHSTFVRSAVRLWGSQRIEETGMEKEAASLLQRIAKFLPREAFCLSPRVDDNRVEILLPVLLRVLPVSKRWELVVILNQAHLVDSDASKAGLLKHLANDSGSKLPLFIQPLMLLPRNIAKQILSEAQNSLGEGKTIFPEENAYGTASLISHCSMRGGSDQPDYWSRRCMVKDESDSSQRTNLIQEEMLQTYWEGLEIKSRILGGKTEESIEAIANPTRARIEDLLKKRSKSPEIRYHYLLTIMNFVKLLDFGKVTEETWPKLLEKTLRDVTVQELSFEESLFSGETAWNQCYFSEGPSQRLVLVESAAKAGDACLRAEIKNLENRSKEPDFNCSSETGNFLSSWGEVFTLRTELVEGLSASASRKGEDIMEGLIQLLLHPLLEIRMEFVKTMAKKGVEIDSPDDIRLVYDTRVMGDRSALKEPNARAEELLVNSNNISSFGRYLDHSALRMEETIREIRSKAQKLPQWISKSGLGSSSGLLLPFHERVVVVRHLSSKLERLGITGVDLVDFAPELSKRVESSLFGRAVSLLDPSKVSQWERAWRLYLRWSRNLEEMLRKLEALAQTYGIESDTSKRFLRIVGSQSSPDIKSLIIKSRSSLFNRFLGLSPKADGLPFDITSRWNGLLSSDKNEEEVQSFIPSRYRLQKPHGAVQETSSPFTILTSLLHKACSSREMLRYVSRDHLLGFIQLVRSNSVVNGETAIGGSPLLDSNCTSKTFEELTKLQEKGSEVSWENWIQHIRLGVKTGLFTSNDILNVRAAIQKAEETVQEKKLTKSRASQQDLPLQLAKLITESEKPIFALPFAQELLQDTDASAWHRRFPFFRPLISHLSRDDLSYWLSGIRKEVLKLGKKQNTRTSEQATAPLVKVSTAKALIEFSDMMKIKNQSSEVISSILEATRVFPNRDVRYVALDSLLDSIRSLELTSDLLWNSIGAFCGDSQKAEELGLEFEETEKEQNREHILRSSFSDEFLQRNQVFAHNYGEKIVLPCIKLKMEENRRSIRKFLAEMRVNPTLLEDSIELIVKHATFFTYSVLPDNIEALKRFLPYLLGSQGSEVDSLGIKDALITDQVFIAYEAVFSALNESVPEWRKKNKSTSGGSIISTEKIDDFWLGSRILKRLCSCIGLVAGMPGDLVENDNRIRWLQSTITSLTTALLSRETPESPRWKETRACEIPGPFRSIFQILIELGRYQYEGGAQGAEVWLLFYRPVLEQIHKSLVVFVSKSSMSSKATLLSLISFASYQLLPLSVLLPAHSASLDLPSRISKVTALILEFLSNIAASFKGLGSALIFLQDPRYDFERLQVSDNHLIMICEDLLDKGSSQNSDLRLLCHLSVKKWIWKISRPSEEVRDLKDRLLENGRKDSDLAVSLVWQG